MALLEELGTDLRQVTTSRGTARLWTLASTVYVTTVSGHMDLEHASLFEAYGADRVRLSGGGLHVFHDWLTMTGYESECRQRLTRWSVKHLDAYAEVHLAVRSKIVAMGVQVANIALRGLIHVHPDRAPIEVALRRVLRVTPDAPRV